MVRKPAPQPLSLGESALPVSDRSQHQHQLQGETLRVVSPDDARFAAGRSPTSPASLKLQAVQAGQSPHSLHHSLHQVSLSPTHSQHSQPLPLPSSHTQSHSQLPSPQASSSQQYQQPLHVADLVQQPLDEDAGSSYQGQQEPDRARDERSPQSQSQPQQAPPPVPNNNNANANANRPPVSFQQKHGHGRRQAEEKASKSNFRFHFGKSTKTDKEKEKQSVSAHTNTGDSTGQSQGQGQGSTSAPGSRAGQVQSEAQVPPKTSGGLPASRTETSFSGDTDSASAKKARQKTFPRLGRTRSVRDEPSPLRSNLNASASTSTSTSTANTPAVPTSATSTGFHKPQVAEPAAQNHDASQRPNQQQQQQQQQQAMKTAPLAHHDRSFREMMASSNRNHSADGRDNRDGRDNQHHPFRPARNDASNPGTGGSFFNGLKNSSRSAADMISKGLFGKNGKGGGAHHAHTERTGEPVVDDEHYVLKVINQPLVEQTRLTRISKRLEGSRDRTEFWMPAFPWRAIDYLNYKGADVEGLYRVPGSGPQIKKWQRRFDTELDVDLFAQEDLYDINIIGSMLKAWLRELPDELFPKEAQERIARECAGAETVPQMLVDELSALSPFKYYLLFAITCHLSLLLAHADKNKMDFRNLCICFQPCMKIDAFSFKFLVCDWRECWKGCANERAYIDEEYRLFAEPPQPLAAPLARDDDDGPEDDDDEWRVPSTGTSPAVFALSMPDAGPSMLPLALADATSEQQQQYEHEHDQYQPQQQQPHQHRGASTPPRHAQMGDLRPLSPIKPLSPMGF